MTQRLRLPSTSPRTPGVLTVLPTATPATALAVAGLVGGFATGQATGRRELAAVVFGLAGVLAGRTWARASGGGTAALLGAGYVAAMGVSHPLAKRTGSWPAVGIVTAAVAAASEAVARR